MQQNDSRQRLTSKVASSTWTAYRRQPSDNSVSSPADPSALPFAPWETTRTCHAVLRRQLHERDRHRVSVRSTRQ